MNRRASTSLLALAALAAIADPAHAHRLDAQCFVRAGWQVQVESWYETGALPRGARVEVFRANGQLLTTGKLDKNGVFVFWFGEVETLKVVVTSVGHRAEATVPVESLARAAACTCAACLTPALPPFLAAALVPPVAGSSPEGSQTVSQAEPLANHGSSFPLGGALLGVGILLTVAILFRWLSLRRSVGTPRQSPDAGAAANRR